MKRKIKGLYLVTDSLLTLGRSVEEIALDACRAGVDILQFRDKNLSDQKFLEKALSLRKIALESGTLFIINDRAHLVEESKADGLHIGQTDIKAAEAREFIGFDKILGVSFRTENEAREAVAAGADYAALSPVFATATKTDLDIPVGLSGVCYFSKILKIPLVAIGGVKASNISEIILSGADCAAVVTAVTMAEDIRSAVIDLKKRIEIGFNLRNRLN